MTDPHSMSGRKKNSTIQVQFSSRVRYPSYKKTFSVGADDELWAELSNRNSSPPPPQSLYRSCWSLVETLLSFQAERKSFIHSVWVKRDVRVISPTPIFSPAHLSVKAREGSGCIFTDSAGPSSPFLFLHTHTFSLYCRQSCVCV